MIHSIINIFTDPQAAFVSIKKKDNLIKVLVIVTILVLAMSVINLADGTAAEAIYLSNSSLDPSYTLGQAESLAQLFAGLTIIFLPLFLVLSAFIVHIIVMIQGKTGFKKTLTIIVYVHLISILGQLIALLVFKATGTTLQYNAFMFLDAANLHPVMSSLIGILDIFTIWRSIVLFFGFKIIHDMTKKEAAITTVLPLVISFIFMIVANYASNAFL